jgi:GAF domain-containing protein
LERQVSELTDEQFVGLLERISAEFQLLLHTFDLTSQQATGALLDEILKVLALKIRQSIGAERATVYLWDHRQNLLRSRFVEHSGMEPFEITLDSRTGIAGRAFRTGIVQNVADVYSDPDFYQLPDQASGYRTKSVLSVPIRDGGGQVFAVAQLLNKAGGGGFTRQDEDKLKDSSVALGLVLEGLRRLAEYYFAPRP